MTELEKMALRRARDLVNEVYNNMFTLGNRVNGDAGKALIEIPAIGTLEHGMSQKLQEAKGWLEGVVK